MTDTAKPSKQGGLDEYSYKVGITPLEVTKDDKKYGKVIAKFHKQAATNNAMIEDKMFYMILNERPKGMSEAEWFKLVRKVVRVEIVQKYPKLIPIGAQLHNMSNQVDTLIEVSTPKGTRSATLVIYDTPEALNEAVNDYNEETGHQDKTEHELAGVVHRYVKYVDDEEASDCGIVRLHRDGFRTGIITHEATHLALHIYQTCWEKQPDVDDDEEFAYLLGDIARQIVLKADTQGNDLATTDHKPSKTSSNPQSKASLKRELT